MRPWLILAAVALARIGFGYQFQTVATLAPDLVPRFHLTYAQLGGIIGAYMLLGVFVALPLGLLGRRFGERIVLGSGLFLMTAGGVVSALGEGPSAIALGRTISGVGAVAMIVLQGKIISDWFTGRRFMIAISVSVGAYPVGVGGAQLVLPWLTGHYGWASGFLSGALLGLLSLLLFLASHQTPATTAAAQGHFSLPSRRECLLLVVAGLTWTAYTSGYAGYTSYIPATLAARGDSVALIGLVMIIGTWGNVPAIMWGGGLAARFGGFRILVIGTVALVIGVVGTALTGWPLAWSVFVGIIGCLHPGVIMAVGTLSAKPENRAVGMGLFYTLYYIGGSAGPALCGWAADMYGGPAGGLLMAALICGLVVPLFMLHRSLTPHAAMLVKP